VSWKENFPTKIRISYNVYKIENWHPVSANAAARYGECSGGEKIIRVDLNYGYVKAANTLLHEIFHAIYTERRLEDFKELNQEKIVHTFADELSRMWQDNPEVFEWIKNGLLSGHGPFDL
jgi:hypothetical protein